jgi:hypothetical protein
LVISYDFGGLRNEVFEKNSELYEVGPLENEDILMELKMEAITDYIKYY